MCFLWWRFKLSFRLKEAPQSVHWKELCSFTKVLVSGSSVSQTSSGLSSWKQNATCQINHEYFPNVMHGAIGSEDLSGRNGYIYCMHYQFIYHTRATLFIDIYKSVLWCQETTDIRRYIHIYDNPLQQETLADMRIWWIYQHEKLLYTPEILSISNGTFNCKRNRRFIHQYRIFTGCSAA